MSAKKRKQPAPRKGRRVFLAVYPYAGKNFGGEWDTSAAQAERTALEWQHGVVGSGEVLVVEARVVRVVRRIQIVKSEGT